MNKNQVFIVDIKKCIKYDLHVDVKSKAYIGNQLVGIEKIGHTEITSETIRKNSVVIKINNKYVELLKLRTLLDYLRVYLESKRKYFTPEDICIYDAEMFEDGCFVDKDTIKPYFNWLDNESISIKQLKKKVKEHNKTFH